MRSSDNKSDRAWRLTLWAGGVLIFINLTLVLALTRQGPTCDSVCQEFIRNAVVVKSSDEMYDNRLIRWHQPIRVGVVNDHQKHVFDLDDLFSDIRNSTGHDILNADDGTLNFVIVLSDDVFSTVGKHEAFFDGLFSLYGKKEGQTLFTFLWDNLGDSEPCFGPVKIGGENPDDLELRHAMIVADFSKDSEDVRLCVLQRITSYLGVWNPDRETIDKIISRSSRPRLTGFGKTIFANIYRNDIRSGDNIEIILDKLN